MPPAVAALIVAAGRGLRAGADAPKQYRRLGGLPVLCRTLLPFLADDRIGTTLVVIGAGDGARYDDAIGQVPQAIRIRLAEPIEGGETRQDSVRAGLEALAAAGFAGSVLVHDAARPLVSPALIERALAASTEHVAAIPALAVTDTVKRVDAAGLIDETLPREQLVFVQTPQAFAFEPLLAAHRAAQAAEARGFTDDSATFPGDPMNLKLTYPGDFEQAEQRFARPLVTRTGTGYDVHAFAEGDHIWLGGIRIPHNRGVTAHSDGDVALHALTDALLGALADGDIGSHFPPSDPQWRGASSDRFLAFAAERVRQRGGRIDHLDLTIVCEGPKVGPHRDTIRARIAEIAGLRSDQVGVKATTSERLGFTGRGEGVVALATATIRLPEPE
jgi:2-C-methyl-D-erythritol 4-phosphate cytidylyltransferase / 2-C-methyl-D-erythritol 2,4-cyclodiphosphate synthase